MADLLNMPLPIY